MAAPILKTSMKCRRWMTIPRHKLIIDFLNTPKRAGEIVQHLQIVGNGGNGKYDRENLSGKHLAKLVSIRAIAKITKHHECYDDFLKYGFKLYGQSAYVATPIAQSIYSFLWGLRDKLSINNFDDLLIPEINNAANKLQLVEVTASLKGGIDRKPFSRALKKGWSEHPDPEIGRVDYWIQFLEREQLTEESVADVPITTNELLAQKISRAVRHPLSDAVYDYLNQQFKWSLNNNNDEVGLYYAQWSHKLDQAVHHFKMAMNYITSIRNIDDVETFSSLSK